MEIDYKTKKLETELTNDKKIVKTYGAKQAKKIRQRIRELAAVDNLSEISNLPPARLHLLIGDLKGLYSVDIDHPYRLLFRAYDVNGIENSEKSQLKKITIEKVENTHD
jgi:plasmid maintenance system killer protein